MVRLSRILALFAVALVCSSGPARAAIALAIEYYDAALDHYFVTSIPSEIAALDSGQFPGWARTGLSFNVYAPGSAVPGSTSVCRFYGSPAAGLDSHFYSASPVECQEVLQRFPDAWLLESNDVFEVFLPDLDTGVCPAGSIPIYRAWNQRADSNHRYTTDLSVLQAMVAKGYVAEGYGPGPAPTAMCSPTGGGGGGSGAPVCSPSANDTFPYVGTTITLSSNCTNSPTSYVWSGCASSTARCMATSMVPGTLTYTVVASNASGASAPSSITVKWLALPPPPACGIVVTTNTVPPVTSTLALLDAVCTNDPTSYAWTNCGGSELCYAHSYAPGVQMYSVAASNPGGAGPTASVDIDWQSTAPPPPGSCGAYPSYLYTDDGWNGTRLTTSAYSDAPGFAGDGVWVVKVSVPPDAASPNLGSFGIAEYNGPPTSRQVTLSRVACDFRPVDPSGVGGPLAMSTGDSVNMAFRLGASSGGVPGLAPGEIYYVNVRNWDVGTESVSCGQDRCDAFMTVKLP